MVSPYVEGILWRVGHYLTTTMNESFYHWEAIMIPKSLNCKGLEYRMRVAFAFFIFTSHQKIKQYDERVLVKNKNTGTFVATTLEKLPRVQQFITDIWIALFPEDPFMLSKTSHWRAQVQKQCQLRGDHLRAKALALSANPLDADQGSANRHLGQRRNAQIDGQYCGVQLSTPPACPRPRACASVSISGRQHADCTELQRSYTNLRDNQGIEDEETS